MKDALKNLCQDPFCLWGVTLSLIPLTLGTFFLASFWSRLPPQVPLFYSRVWGEEQLAQKYQIIILPAFAILAFLFNFFVSARLFPKEPLLARILIGSSCLLVFILILALFQIVNLIV